MHKISNNSVQKTSLSWFVWNYIKPKWGLVCLSLIFMAIEGSMLGLISYSVKELFDSVFVPQDRSSVWFVGILIFSIFSIRAIAGFLQRSLILKAGIEIVSKIQKDISAHIIDLDYEFFFKNSPGDLIERIKGDGQIIQVNFVQIVMALGRDTVSLAALLTVAFWIDWKWAIISLLGLPILIIPILLLQKFIHSISRKSRVSSARTTTLLDEAFHGVASIKLNGIEKYIKDRLNKVIDRTRDAWFGAELGVAGMPALIDLVAALGFLGVMVFGGMEIIDGKKSIGDFMSFFTAMALIFEPLRRLSNVSGQLQLLNASLDRLHYVYKVSPKIANRIDQKTNRLSKSKSYLEFQNVSLNYGEENILSGISIKIEKGQSVALVGASGSGKSTMLNLISRLIEPTSGEIFLEGRNLRDVPVGDLRSTISVVSQENNLFDDSIHRNIVLERKVENNELFLDILNKAAVSDFVNNLDEGLDFQVGPRGLNLSGGQRQRIAIARALFRDSELMLLDEPTSALDSETENRVQKNTKKFFDKKTVITTTHKLEIAKYADKIFVFQEGKIVAQGRHVDLIKKQGPYLNLWASQKENNKS